MDCTLRVGESVKIKRAFFTKSWSVVYAGMPNDNTYSLAVTWSVNYYSTAYNLFFQKGTRELPFLKGRLLIKGVSSSEITLEYQG
jgi:hypothetical protein